MFVSVVIPLFNKQNHILRTVHSVLNQSHSNFELIIVDDGSTDSGVDFVKSVSDPRIHLVVQSNSGVSVARNTGVRYAKGAWVSFLDADDEYQPQFLERIVAFILKHKDSDLVMVGANYRFGSDGPFAVDERMETGIYPYYDLFRNHHSPNNSSTTVVNKAQFTHVGGFPAGVLRQEDWVLWFKLSFVGSFGFIGEALGVYHNIEGSASRVVLDSKVHYRDASLLPKIVDEYIGLYVSSADSRRAILACMNEYRVNAAGLLARDGGKREALKMLMGIRFRYFSSDRRGNLPFLFRHLLAPQVIKPIFRNIKDLVWSLRCGLFW